jgi:hypothetical protein
MGARHRARIALTAADELPSPLFGHQPATPRSGQFIIGPAVALGGATPADPPPRVSARAPTATPDSPRPAATSFDALRDPHPCIGSRR